jgi:N-ethylmaleimide reductase
MAPLTRCRSPDGVPTEAVAKHYAARASAGLLIAEGAIVSEYGRGYPNTPGIHSAEQVSADTATLHASPSDGRQSFGPVSSRSAPRSATS